MSDVTLLRTLTRKSTFKFGKFYDLTVQMAIDSYTSKAYSLIVFYYYNSSKISFTEDILLECGIYEDLRIYKPGNISNDEYLEQEIKCFNNRKIEFDKLSIDKQNQLTSNMKKLNNQNIKYSKTKSENIGNKDSMRLHNQGFFRNKS